MSDFLSELIMRSREPATAIMPRLASSVFSDTPAATRAIQEESGESFAPDETKFARSTKPIPD